MSHSTSDGESPLVFVSDIVQYFYCPRKIYYLKVLGMPFKARRKMDLGRTEDEREEDRLGERKSVYGFPHSQVTEVIHNLYLEDNSLGMAGQLDTLIRLQSGELIPVDSKYTEEVRVQRHYRKQLVAYSLLVESKYRTKVNRGIIYFSKQKEPVIVDLVEGEKSALLNDLDRIRRILKGELLPRKVAEEKCGYCEVSKFCV